MVEKKDKANKFVVSVCIGFLIFVFGSILILTFTRFVLVKKIGMNNKFTEFVFAGQEELNTGGEIKQINWEKLYPFSRKSEEKVMSGKSKTESYQEHVNTIKKKLEEYSSKRLFGYSNLMEIAKKYDTWIGWNMVSYGEYNGIVEMKDHYLTSYEEEKDVTEQIKSLVAFQQFVKEQGAEFLYVQAPYKVSEYEDKDISGTLDFSNQNSNRLIANIKKANVDVLDLRENIQKEGLANHQLFYRTDHHWLTTTGLWAANRILTYCNKEYGFQADTSLLELDQFGQKVYKNWFLGSQGKKVTLTRTKPDDFTLLYPEYETSFHYVVPAMSIDQISDYSVIYNMKEIAEKNYYAKNPYGGCNYGDQPVVTIDNLLAKDDKKILLIHDSFGDCMVSCLALGEARVDSLDLRSFDGSVEAYVKEAKPDIVMVLYNPNQITDIDWTTHKSCWDFR